MTPTRVETKLYTGQITETSTSKQWDTFLFSKITREYHLCMTKEGIAKAFQVLFNEGYNFDALFS